MTGVAPVVEAADVVADAVPAAEAERCDVCGHDQSAHDKVAARFCAATVQSALTRGCLCR